ncbi:DUF4230 domain-containing protein [Lachnospiraceae bacterium C1.1]|nr:DUF4230 domain-containing protein [Lachnospiraceae bacterium C1.1]
MTKRKIVVFMTSFIIFFLSGFLFAKYTIPPKEIVSERIVERKIQLPGETVKRTVTKDDIEAKLKEMSELTTYSCEYTVSQSEQESRYFSSLEILGTTNTIDITARGIVKVGYDVSDIKVKVGDDKIYISIPKAQLNDNYVIWDSMQCNEVNTPLNPIEISQYQNVISEIEAKGLKQAESKGIYDAAEKNLKVVINGFFSEFVDYEIIYM